MHLVYTAYVYLFFLDKGVLQHAAVYTEENRSVVQQQAFSQKKIFLSRICYITIAICGKLLVVVVRNGAMSTRDIIISEGDSHFPEKATEGGKGGERGRGEGG